MRVYQQTASKTYSMNIYIYQEHYDDSVDDISEDWKMLTRYESVCKILEELKDKGVRNENIQI